MLKAIRKIILHTLGEIPVYSFHPLLEPKFKEKNDCEKIYSANYGKCRK